MDEKKMITSNGLQSRIYTVRGFQVMVDSDLAELYRTEVKVLNQAVKRNLDRFPAEFMFQLTTIEYDSLRSHFVTLDEGRGKYRKYLPYVFTEQGVAMLAGVLKSETAIKTSIQIINAFVAMRRFIATNAQVFHRLDAVEKRQVEHKADADSKFEKIFNAIEAKEIIPKQGIFFNGQIFDAYKFVSDLFRTAKESIVIIDNYIDDTVLAHLRQLATALKPHDAPNTTTITCFFPSKQV